MSLEALIITVLSNLALWGGAGLIACRLLHGFWDRVFATAVLGWTALIVVLEVLSQFGQMRFPAVAAFVAAFLFVTMAVARGRLRRCENRIETSATTSKRGSSDPNRRGPGRPGIQWRGGGITALPAAALLLALGVGLYHLYRGLRFPVEPVSDAPIYHLYFAVRWYQAGQIELVATPFGELAATYFPSNGALWFCWLVMTSGSETIAKVGQWPFWLLCGMVVYALARKSGASRDAALFPAVFWATGSSVLLQGAGLANVDLIAAAWYLIGIYFLARTAESLKRSTAHRGTGNSHGDGAKGSDVGVSRDVAALREKAHAAEEPANGGSAQPAFVLLFGLALGAALGTHATALFFVPLLLAPALWLIVAHTQRWRHLVLLTVGLVIPSGYWYARNWAATGNPVYPVQVDVLGIPVLAGWYDWAAMRQSNYHIPTTNLTALAERAASMIDLRASLLMRAWRNSRQNVSWSSVALLAAHLSPWLLGIFWGLAEPVVGAWRRLSDSATHRDTGRLSLFLTLLGITYVAVYWWLVPYQSQQRFLFPAAAIMVVPFARLLMRRYWLQATAVVILAAHLFLPIWPGSRDRGFSLTPHAWQSIPSSFYPAWDFAANLYPAWQALDEHSPPVGARVAYAGTNLPYYLFGRGLRDRVYYVNVNVHQGFLPHDYHLGRVAQGNASLAPDPWPEWYRDDSDYDAWLANLRRWGIDFLFVARVNQHGRPDAVAIPPFPIELRWARRHPEHFESIPVGTAPGLKVPWAYVFRVREAGL